MRDKGGNGDGVVDIHDPVFSSLRLWQDINHNGLSEASELHTLAESGIKSMELDYKESKRTDEFGNRFRYRAKVWDTGRAKLRRWAWDVFLLTNQFADSETKTPLQLALRRGFENSGGSRRRTVR